MDALEHAFRSIWEPSLSSLLKASKDKTITSMGRFRLSVQSWTEISTYSIRQYWGSHCRNLGRNTQSCAIGERNMRSRGLWVKKDNLTAVRPPRRLRDRSPSVRHESTKWQIEVKQEWEFEVHSYTMNFALISVYYAGYRNCESAFSGLEDTLSISTKASRRTPGLFLRMERSVFNYCSSE